MHILWFKIKHNFNVYFVWDNFHVARSYVYLYLPRGAFRYLVYQLTPKYFWSHLVASNDLPATI